jgi:uncharacterized membrane protein YkoI
MIMKRFLLVMLSVACLASVVSAVHARVPPGEYRGAISPGNTPGGYRLQLAAEGITLEQAAARVRKQSGGKLLSADEQQKAGDRVYRIKVLMPDGVVKIFNIDPITGSPIRQQR